MVSPVKLDLGHAWSILKEYSEQPADKRIKVIFDSFLFNSAFENILKQHDPARFFIPQLLEGVNLVPLFLKASACQNQLLSRFFHEKLQQQGMDLTYLPNYSEESFKELHNLFKNKILDKIPVIYQQQEYFHAACVKGHLDLVGDFVAAYIRDKTLDAKINAPGLGGYTPLQLACQANNIDIIKHLGQKGAGFEKNGKEERIKNSALKMAILFNSHLAAGYILDRKLHTDFSDPDSKDSLLHLAAKYSNREIISRLLYHNPSDLNKVGTDNFTPLQRAISSRNMDAAKYLAWEKETKMDVVDKSGHDLIDLYIKSFAGMPKDLVDIDEEFILLLQEKGAKPKEQPFKIATLQELFTWNFERAFSFCRKFNVQLDKKLKWSLIARGMLNKETKKLLLDTKDTDFLQDGDLDLITRILEIENEAVRVENLEMVLETGKYTWPKLAQDRNGEIFLLLMKHKKISALLKFLPMVDLTQYTDTSKNNLLHLLIPVLANISDAVEWEKLARYILTQADVINPWLMNAEGKAPVALYTCPALNFLEGLVKKMKKHPYFTECQNLKTEDYNINEHVFWNHLMKINLFNQVGASIKGLEYEVRNLYWPLLSIFEKESWEKWINSIDSLVLTLEECDKQLFRLKLLDIASRRFINIPFIHDSVKLLIDKLTQKKNQLQPSREVAISKTSAIGVNNKNNGGNHSSPTTTQPSSKKQKTTTVVHK